MKAAILAGGQGTRLKPITDYIPKPLIPINNVPILEWQIRYLKKFGIRDVIVCTGYKTDQIENFLKKKDLGVKVKISIEKTPLGTGGALKKIAPLIKEKSFLVFNGDTITNMNLKKMLTTTNSIAAIELRTKFGIVETVDSKVKKFREKKEISNVWMNAGIYHLNKKILKDLPKKGDIEKTTFPKYAQKGMLNTIKFRNVMWYSIDSYKDIEECSKVIGKIIK